MSFSQVSNKKLFLSPKAQKMEVDKGLPISQTSSSRNNPILDSPVEQHDKNDVSGECTPIRTSQDQDDSNQPTGTVALCVPNPSEEGKTEEVITERDPVDTNETLNLFDDKDLESPTRETVHPGLTLTSKHSILISSKT